MLLAIETISVQREEGRENKTALLDEKGINHGELK